MPYFGSWPLWFPLFLESCRLNPSIDWLFFTDCGTPENVPKNVRIVPMTFRDYCARVSTTLGIEFSPENPYKLCDIRPAFGYIHQIEIKRYDFWAFGDIDLIYGNLRHYFTDERLSKSDLLATHSRRISGHCCLLRNNQKIREAFRRIPEWEVLLSDPKHRAVDEGAFSKIFLRHKDWPRWLAKIASLFNSLRRRAEFIEAYSTPGARIPWTTGNKTFPRYWYWDNGRLTNDIDNDREFPYFHFLVWKRSWALQNQMQFGLDDQHLNKKWQVSIDGFSQFSSERRPGETYE